MSKINLTLSVAMGLVLGGSMYATDPKNDIDRFDINSIEYIEDEPEIDLGFDTANYLPEDFDPYKFYFDLNSVEYLEDDTLDFDSKKHLPKDFNAYAFPSDFRNIDYIDLEDEIELDFDPVKNLPEGFDAYIRM